jgi:tetratricopeptide (TPR) repeat protein
VNTGLVQLQRHDAKAAQAAFHEALRLEANHAVANWQLAKLLPRGQDPLARTLLERAVASEPALTDARIDLAALLMRTLLLTEAIAVLETGIELAKDDPRLWSQLAAARARHRDPLALTAARRARELGADDLTSHCYIGLAFQAFGEWDDAEAAFRKALALRPQHFVALCNLALILLELDRPAEALPLARSAIALDPDSIPAQTALGRALAATGDAQAAVTILEEIVERTRRSDPSALYELALALERTGDSERALAAAQRASRLAAEKRGFANLRSDLEALLQRLQ